MTPAKTRGLLLALALAILGGQAASQHGKSVDGKGRMEGPQGIDSLDLELTPYGPPSVTTDKIYMSSTPNTEEILDTLVPGRRKP